jgi:hypothetical protein
VLLIFAAYLSATTIIETGKVKAMSYEDIEAVVQHERSVLSRRQAKCSR